MENYMTVTQKKPVESRDLKIALVNALKKGTIHLQELKQGSIAFRKLPKGSYRRKVGGKMYTPTRLKELKREFPKFIELNNGNELMLCWFTFEDLMKTASIV